MIEGVLVFFACWSALGIWSAVAALGRIEKLLRRPQETASE